ncbi:uracil-DNA glycosylase [Golden Marseillevirus]|uniref:uracil-DNA glycosylase n=1 Tax=Golden Marseillevirus TaxID=1720526 RepID=UPI000877AB07|nr:uracil-DNA glycosylase [Golden Marseillevirus]ALX27619.1 uracil-DNA glycosylase [Golden Marseillevirus]
MQSPSDEQLLNFCLFYPEMFQKRDGREVSFCQRVEQRYERGNSHLGVQSSAHRTNLRL